MFKVSNVSLLLFKGSWNMTPTQNNAPCVATWNAKSLQSYPYIIHFSIQAGSHPQDRRYFHHFMIVLLMRSSCTKKYIRTYKPRPGEVFRSKSPSSTSPYHRVTMSWIACQSHSWEPHATYGLKVCIKPGFQNGYKVPVTQLVSLPDFFQQLVVC